MSANFVLILFCLTIGILLRLTRRFPEKSPQAFNAYVIWVALPALVLVQIPALLASSKIDVSMLIPVTMAWVLFIVSVVFFHVVGHRLKWSRSRIGALALTGGLGNTAFVGFPLLESFYGAEGLRVGLLVDQPGTFLVLSTLGLLVAIFYSSQEGRSLGFRFILKNVFQFPPFVALLIAILWHCSGTYSDTGVLYSVLTRLSATLVPLALVAVGFQIKITRRSLRQQWKPLLVGLGFKLFLAPLFFVMLYLVCLGQNGSMVKITILESAMAPMITASVVAEEYGLDAQIASLMVGVGIPISLLSVYLWNLAIH